jgi:hypothetical protein
MRPAAASHGKTAYGVTMTEHFVVLVAWCGRYARAVSSFERNDFEGTAVGTATQHHPHGDCAMRESILQEPKPFSEWTITADDADARIARALRLCCRQSTSGDVRRGCEGAFAAKDCRPHTPVGSLARRP